jgi:hypothetical protein
MVRASDLELMVVARVAVPTGDEVGPVVRLIRDITGDRGAPVLVKARQ